MAHTRKRPILVLTCLAVLVAAAGYYVWREGRQPAAPVNGDAAAGPPARGGELTALLRSEPATYIRATEVRGTAASDLFSLLTDGRLARVNRLTDTLEPSLAERWTESDDHLTYTLTLRDGVSFSDGAPFTSADVLFSFAAVYDARVNSGLASDLKIAGLPLQVEAPDPRTVVIRFPAPFAPGLRLLDNLPIMPSHILRAALDAGQLAEAGKAGTPPDRLVGLGPFVLTEHVSGQRLRFARNPHYWRQAADGTPLPYLDALTVLVVSDQNSETLRMQSGDADLMVNGDIRPEDYASFRRLSDQGRMRLIPAGIGLDPSLLWFNLSPGTAGDPRSSWIRQTAFRHAVSCAVDRQAIVDAVYLGEGVPIYGPVTPGNRLWYVPPADPCVHDVARARELLASVGLTDRNGDGLLEDAIGTPARFSLLTQSGHTIRERTASMIQEQLRQVGLTVDVVGMDPGGLGQRWQRGDYDSIYFGVQNSQTDPALTPQFWLSDGVFHFWNPGQKTPATGWERQIDELMHRQAATFEPAERQRLFAEVQRLFEQEMPALYFAAPRVTLAVSSRVRNAQPAPQIPQLLWSPDTLAVAGPGR